MSNSSPVAPATALTILDNEIRCINGLYSLTICIALLVVKINIRHVIGNKNIKLFDLINFIEKGGIPSILKKQGIGTFVCKELIIAYAAWISLKFHLAVIRAFLATIDVTTITNPQNESLSWKNLLISGCNNALPRRRSS